MNNEEKWLLKEKYQGTTCPEFLTDCRRLTEGEPLAYIIGTIPFCNTTIYLDSRPLIPRTETEYWVAKAITDIASRKEPLVLDLCAGSGAIGVAVLANVSSARVDFGEIDTRHHSTILKNVHENGIDSTRARIFGGDLFTKIGSRYDVILTNPPYIDPTRDRSEHSVRTYEPHRALYGGVRGTAYIRTIIREAPRHLTRNGVLYLEHEPEQEEEIRTYAKTISLQVTSHKDQYDRVRYSILK